MSETARRASKFTDAFRRRPAVFPLLLLASGILCGDYLPDYPWFWLIAMVTPSIVAAVAIHRTRIATACLTASIFLLGLTAAQIERFNYPANDIGSYTTDTARLAQVELKLDESPCLLGQPPAQLRALPPKQIALGRVVAVRCVTGWQPASGRVALSIEQLNPRLAAGQTIRATGLLSRPLPPENPGQFDWADYYRRQHILAELRVNHADGVEIIRDDGPPILTEARDKVRHLLAMGFSQEQSFDHSLLRALLLGDSDPQLREIQDEFTRTGTIHYLSVSGLHIAIMGGFMLLLCRLLRCPPRIAVTIAMAFVILYALIALPSWPGVRSTVMCIAGGAGLIWRRSLDSVNLLALAVAAVLLYQPGDLSEGGFQVSFAAVLGMVLCGNRLLNWIWNLRSPVAPTFGIQYRSPLQNAIRSVFRFVLGTLTAGCVAWLVSMPLVAYHFSQITPYSAPAGIVLLPITVLAMIAGTMKILLTACWPSAAGLWAATCVQPVTWMHEIVLRIDSLAGSSVRAATPSVWTIALYYAVLGVAFVPWKRYAVRCVAFLAAPAACVLFFISAAHVSSATAAPAHHHIQITLLSVGAGQTAVVRTSADHAVLIDAGSSTLADVRRTVLSPYLQFEGCRNIDRIFLSHGDFDHISAAADIFAAYSEPDILISPHFIRHAVGNIPAESLLKAVEDANRDLHIIHQGDHLDLGDSASIDVLWPPVDCPMNSNDCGLVLQLHYANRTVLFPADIQVAPEQALLANPALLKSDILIAPHHGSAETSTAAFMQAVAPQMVLASNAAKLTHKQKVFDELAQDYPVYRTSRCGAITITIDDAGNISMETFNGAGPVQAGARH